MGSVTKVASASRGGSLPCDGVIARASDWFLNMNVVHASSWPLRALVAAAALVSTPPPPSDFGNALWPVTLVRDGGVASKLCHITLCILSSIAFQVAPLSSTGEERLGKCPATKPWRSRMICLCWVRWVRSQGCSESKPALHNAAMLALEASYAGGSAALVVGGGAQTEGAVRACDGVQTSPTHTRTFFSAVMTMHVSMSLLD